MKKLNKKTPLVFRISMILFCALLASIYLTGGLYARYTAHATGSGSAQVASFSFDDDLSEQDTTIPLSFAPGDKDSTTISIQNKGDVTIRYVVKVQNLTKNLPIEDAVISSEDIARGGSTTFTWEVEWPQSENSVSYMGKMDIIRIIVTAEQVD